MAKKNGKAKSIPGVPDGTPTFKRDVPVDLTPEEIQEKGQRAAKLDDECDEISSKLKTVGKELRDELKMKRGQIRALHKEISSGTEERKVACYNAMDYQRGEVRVVRVDTGATVESRPMDASERQAEMPLAKGRGGRKAAPQEPSEGDSASAE